MQKQYLKAFHAFKDFTTKDTKLPQKRKDKRLRQI